jgi:hypothetical protein
LWEVAKIIAAVTLIAFFLGTRIRGETRPSVSSGSREVITVEVLPLPTKNFQVGEWLLLPNYPAVSFCAFPDIRVYGQALPQELCPKGVSISVHLFPQDQVEVIGQAELLTNPSGQKEWYWPVKGVQAGAYVEGSLGWVPDKLNYWAGDPQRPRPIPKVTIGEVLKASYGFRARDLPQGKPKDCNGSTCYIWGGETVRIQEGPVLGRDSHYWCLVVGESGVIGWIPCEFQKLP